jgi:hypothetical protein
MREWLLGLLRRGFPGIFDRLTARIYSEELEIGIISNSLIRV